jgi:hypothetical protein
MLSCQRRSACSLSGIARCRPAEQAGLRIETSSRQSGPGSTPSSCVRRTKARSISSRAAGRPTSTLPHGSTERSSGPVSAMRATSASGSWYPIARQMLRVVRAQRSRGATEVMACCRTANRARSPPAFAGELISPWLPAWLPRTAFTADICGFGRSRQVPGPAVLRDFRVAPVRDELDLAVLAVWGSGVRVPSAPRSWRFAVVRFRSPTSANPETGQPPHCRCGQGGSLPN